MKQRVRRIVVGASVVAAVGIALLHTGSLPVTTNDLSIYLAMGREMAATGALLEQDIHTFTAQGTPFVNGTWGFSVLAWNLHEALGPNGLRLLNGLAVAAAVAAADNGDAPSLTLAIVNAAAFTSAALMFATKL